MPGSVVMPELAWPKTGEILLIASITTETLSWVGLSLRMSLIVGPE